MDRWLYVVPGKRVVLGFGSSRQVEFVFDQRNFILNESAREAGCQIGGRQAEINAIVNVVAILPPAETQHHIVSPSDFEAVLKIEIERAHSLGSKTRDPVRVVVGLHREIRCVLEGMAPACQDVTADVAHQAGRSIDEWGKR